MSTRIALALVLAYVITHVARDHTSTSLLLVGSVLDPSRPTRGC
jgi:hypothetical protein